MGKLRLAQATGFPILWTRGVQAPRSLSPGLDLWIGAEGARQRGKLEEEAEGWAAGHCLEKDRGLCRARPPASHTRAPLTCTHTGRYVCVPCRVPKRGRPRPVACPPIHVHTPHPPTRPHTRVTQHGAHRGCGAHRRAQEHPVPHSRAPPPPGSALGVLPSHPDCAWTAGPGVFSARKTDFRR